MLRKNEKSFHARDSTDMRVLGIVEFFRTISSALTNFYISARSCNRSRRTCHDSEESKHGNTDHYIASGENTCYFLKTGSQYRAFFS